MEKEEPKYIKRGERVGLCIGKRGEPFVNLIIKNEENGLNKEITFLIDTGFNGYLQIDDETISSLKLNIIKKDKTKGFDMVEREVGILKTKIKLAHIEISNVPVQTISKGMFLIGTSLLAKLKSMLIIDYRHGKIVLTLEPGVQEKVHKAVEKHSS